MECTYVVASDVTCTAQIYGFSLWNNRLGCGWCAVIGTGPDRSAHTCYNCMKRIDDLCCCSVLFVVSIEATNLLRGVLLHRLVNLRHASTNT